MTRRVSSVPVVPSLLMLAPLPALAPLPPALARAVSDDTIRRARALGVTVAPPNVEALKTKLAQRSLPASADTREMLPELRRTERLVALHASRAKDAHLLKAQAEAEFQAAPDPKARRAAERKIDRAEEKLSYAESTAAAYQRELERTKAEASRLAEYDALRVLAPCERASALAWISHVSLADLESAQDAYRRAKRHLEDATVAVKPVASEPWDHPVVATYLRAEKADTDAAARLHLATEADRFWDEAARKARKAVPERERRFAEWEERRRALAARDPAVGARIAQRRERG